MTSVQVVIFLAIPSGHARSYVVTINFHTTDAVQQLALPGSLLFRRFLCHSDPAHPYCYLSFFSPLFAARLRFSTGQARPREQALRITKLRRDNCVYLTRKASLATCARSGIPM